MGSTDADTELAAELAGIPLLSLAELRQRWAALVAKPLPRVRRTLLALALAWELQAQVQGGLPPLVQRRLAQLAGGQAKGESEVEGRPLSEAIASCEQSMFRSEAI